MINFCSSKHMAPRKLFSRLELMFCILFWGQRWFVTDTHTRKLCIELSEENVLK